MNPARISSVNFDAVVEILLGSKPKYERDKGTGLLRLDRVLYPSTHYPSNYGFTPLTSAEDGDPLDALMLNDEKFQPLSLIPSRPYRRWHNST